MNSCIGRKMAVRTKIEERSGLRGKLKVFTIGYSDEATGIKGIQFSQLWAKNFRIGYP